MDSPRETVCRFVVVAPDGRRSSEWRVWTGQEGKKPTDDVYLAPRTQIVDFKISLHKDGWGQYGLSQAVRDAARPGDRRALLRWELSETEIFPGWTPAYCLQFPESELAAVPLSDETQVEIPASGVGAAIAVMIMTSKAGTQLPDGLGDGIIGTLDRKNGGRVAILAMPVRFDAALLSALDSPSDGLSPWAIPGTQGEHEPYGWIVHRGTDGTRRSTEFNTELRATEQRPFSLPDFPGVIRPWNERPTAIDDRGLECAVLVCSSSEQPQLFVDTRARCDHQHLGRDATDLVIAHQRGKLDHGWGRLGNSGHYTCISMPRVLEESGGMDPSQWAPGPGRDSG